MVGLSLSDLAQLTTQAQKGRRLCQPLVRYSDNRPAPYRRARSGFRQVFEQMKTLAITYRSSGLARQSYVL